MPGRAGQGPAPLAARPTGARSTRRPLAQRLRAASPPSRPRLGASTSQGVRAPSALPHRQNFSQLSGWHNAHLSALAACGRGRGRGPGPAPHGACRAAPPFFAGHQRASPVPPRPLRAAAAPAAGFLRGAGRPPLRNSFLRRSAGAAAALAPLPGPAVEGRNAEQSSGGRASHNHGLFLPVARGWRNASPPPRSPRSCTTGASGNRVPVQGRGRLRVRRSFPPERLLRNFGKLLPGVSYGDGKGERQSPREHAVLCCPRNSGWPGQVPWCLPAPLVPGSAQPRPQRLGDRCPSHRRPGCRPRTAPAGSGSRLPTSAGLGCAGRAAA